MLAHLSHPWLLPPLSAPLQGAVHVARALLQDATHPKELRKYIAGSLSRPADGITAPAAAEVPAGAETPRVGAPGGADRAKYSCRNGSMRVPGKPAAHMPLHRLKRRRLHPPSLPQAGGKATPGSPTEPMAPATPSRPSTRHAVGEATAAESLGIDFTGGAAGEGEPAPRTSYLRPLPPAAAASKDARCVWCWSRENGIMQLPCVPSQLTCPPARPQAGVGPALHRAPRPGPRRGRGAVRGRERGAPCARRRRGGPARAPEPALRGDYGSRQGEERGSGAGPDCLNVNYESCLRVDAPPASRLGGSGRRAPAQPCQLMGAH